MKFEKELGLKKLVGFCFLYFESRIFEPIGKSRRHDLARELGYLDEDVIHFSKEIPGIRRLTF